MLLALVEVTLGSSSGIQGMWYCVSQEHFGRSSSKLFLEYITAVVGQIPDVMRQLTVLHNIVWLIGLNVKI